MKKFILASVFIAASAVHAADNATPAVDAKVVDAKAPAASESIFSKAWSKLPNCPECVVNAKQAVEAKMVAHPWYSAAVVAVVTVATVKALDYAFAQNEDEDSGF